jgi:hypothetical protein
MKQTTITHMIPGQGWRAVYQHDTDDGYYSTPLTFWAARSNPDGQTPVVGYVAAGRDVEAAPDLPRFLCYATDDEARRLIEDM